MTDHLTEAEIAELEAALEKATKGEWRLGATRGTLVGSLNDAGEWQETIALVKTSPHDAAYIVAAQPRKVRALLAEVKRLREISAALWEVYHQAIHALDDGEDLGAGEHRIGDVEPLNKALDAFEEAFPELRHGEVSTHDKSWSAALAGEKEPKP